MFRTLATIALIVCVLFVAAKFVEQEQHPITRQPQVAGTISYVIDGDSAVVSCQDGSKVTIRLEGIDAPEIGQPYGSESKRWLAEATANASVRAVASGTDRYGRMLADLYVGDRWLNLESVTSGMSWHYVQYKQDKVLASAQVQAREASRGLWQDAAPIAPWDHRSNQKIENEPPAIRQEER